MLYLIYVNVNTPLTQFYDFCKVIVEQKACQDICRVDLFRTCTDEPNSTTYSDVKCCSLVFVYLYIPVAGFDTFFTGICVARTLLLFAYCQVDARSPIMQRIGFPVLYFDVHVIFYVIMSFQLVALNFALK